MGGHDAGEVASNMVIDALRALPPLDDLDELSGSASQALQQVNRDLIGLARSQGGGKTIGTTVVGLAITDDAFRCFWIGDSRGYLLRDGEITRITHDHSLVQNLVDAGMIKPEEAETHENANLITRAVGVAENVEVDIVSGDANTGDVFVLASDGVTRVVSDSELADELGRSSPGEAADNIVEMVLARGAPDNLSLIIAKLL
jgi:serine/threonine protein phosphatase PrpC